MYESHIFTVNRVQVVLPDKRVRDYDLVEIQNAVTILPLDNEGNVYFVRQFRTGAGKSLLELPAGKIENGEEALTTAEREIREETGMAATNMKPLGKFYVSPGYSTEYMYTFLATGLYEAPLDPDADEFLNLEKFPLSKVIEMLHAGEIEDAKSLATIMQAMPFIRP
jgi:ADP-ribose pyrophosphatase